MANAKTFCGLKNPHSNKKEKFRKYPGFRGQFFLDYIWYLSSLWLKGQIPHGSGLFLCNQNPFNVLCSQRMFHLALFNSARGTTCCLNIIILHLIEFGSLFDIQKDSCKSLLFRGILQVELRAKKRWKHLIGVHKSSNFDRERKTFEDMCCGLLLGTAVKAYRKAYLSKST